MTNALAAADTVLSSARRRTVLRGVGGIREVSQGPTRVEVQPYPLGGHAQRDEVVAGRVGDRQHRHAVAVAAGIGRFLVDRRVDERDETAEQRLTDHPRCVADTLHAPDVLQLTLAAKLHFQRHEWPRQRRESW